MADPFKPFDAVPRTIPPVSQKTYPVAGILTTVFGLDELPAKASEVACLWLLHPRLANQERMTGIATAAITDWNNRIRTGHADTSQSTKGLIAVAFDQRNHGTRLVDPMGNEAWRQGNPRHAQDMFSIFQGTARDVSLLIDYLPSFVFPRSERKITKNLVLGVSLGGHAAWSCVLHEPRVTAGVIIIGCPDYVNLMADRARLSKLPEWTSSDPPGSQFLGSEAFPASLLDTVQKYDPASLFLSYLDMKSAEPLRNHTLPEPTEKEKLALQPVLTHCLVGKRILNLSGGVDKLVPYHRGQAFLSWLKQAISPNGWFSDGAVTLEDVIDEGAAHEVTPKMVDEAVRFISDTLATNDEGSKKTGFVRESKI
ncbi:Alpha/Beta hydrolase protein [Aspergillus bertholletiae]|uniref:Alpha/Beta hydrolase protein n=1 Tax=Aspergillus bertholletiae TaxID=1226010 RepID=A0A5N7AZV0_9EURO|nr:Alpha/Beta hydrolase protein [Aspergillus bertholletiae]